ncbi:hypothetical protein [Nostoc sp.]|uniref:hypothetical protein n=1 Tax=Nostoc sp. TaxID=1180 RepID=UPI002FF5824D
MHHSLKIKILDLDHIESIVEQDITDVEAEKIVGGTLSVSDSLVKFKLSVIGALNVSKSQVGSLVNHEVLESHLFSPPIPPRPSWIPRVQPIILLPKPDL